MGGLVFTAIFTDSAVLRAYTLQSVLLVSVWPMFIAALISPITGVILGLGGKYGLRRYWWDAIELGIWFCVCSYGAPGIIIEVRPASAAPGCWARSSTHPPL